MQALIWIGAALTLAGVAGLVWSILLALRARRSGQDTQAEDGGQDGFTGRGRHSRRP